MVSQSLKASKILDKENINCEIINIHTLKPINEKIINLLKKFRKIITIEEHSVIGGLGSIIAEKIAQHSIKCRLLTIGLPDFFGPTGTYDYLLDYHGLSGEKIAKDLLGIFFFRILT